MIIGSYQSLISFIGTDNIPAIGPLKNCVAQLNKICSCQKQRKGQKSEECNKLYIDIVNNTISSMIDYLKSKTTDSEIVFSHNSHHIIKKVTLR
jgi:hypothetical protein